jgi:hypothetical protein
MNNQRRRIVQELRRIEQELQRTQSPVRARRLIEQMRSLRLQLVEMEKEQAREARADLQRIAGEMTTDLVVGLVLFGVLRKAMEGKQASALSIEEEQQRIDAIAAELLADVDLHF